MVTASCHGLSTPATCLSLGKNHPGKGTFLPLRVQTGEGVKAQPDERADTHAGRDAQEVTHRFHSRELLTLTNRGGDDERYIRCPRDHDRCPPGAQTPAFHREQATCRRQGEHDEFEHFPPEFSGAIIPSVVVKQVLTTTGVVLIAALLGFAPGEANSDARTDTSTLLRDLGFSLSATRAATTSPSTSQSGVLVPTPWGEVEATIVSTPVDRMLRVPLSSGTDTSRLQPYFTAGSRKNVDEDPVLEQMRTTTFADEPRANMKAGAGVIWKVDDNVELFGEYQFMRLQRDGSSRGAIGPLGTGLDSTGFSLGLSIRY